MKVSSQILILGTCYLGIILGQEAGKNGTTGTLGTTGATKTVQSPAPSSSPAPAVKNATTAPVIPVQDQLDFWAAYSAYLEANTNVENFTKSRDSLYQSFLAQRAVTAKTCGEKWELQQDPQTRKLKCGVPEVKPPVPEAKK